MTKLQMRSFSLPHIHSPKSIKRRSFGTDNINASPAARLPADVLVYIFMLLRDDYSSAEDETSLSWITVTHVCRRWREIALEVAGLWTAMFYGSPQSWGELINRSCEAPADVVLDIDKDADVQAALPIMHHLHRFERFVMHGSEIFDVIPTLVDQAPLLQTLMLQFNNYEHPQDNPLKVDDNVLSSLFGGSLPRLRTLLLSRIPLRADCHLFVPTLTSLELHGCEYENLSVRVPLAGLVEVLARLPLLEKLALEDIFANPDTSDLLLESLAHIPVAQLPHLRTLSNMTPFPSINKAFMGHLHAPNLTDFSAQTKVNTASEVVIIPLISWTQDPTSFIALYIHALPGYLGATGGPACFSDDKGASADDDPPFSLSLESSEIILSDAVMELCAQLPLHLVRSFHFLYDDSFRWAPLLRQMHDLEEIKAKLINWKDLLEALAVTVNDDSHDGPCCLLCPMLKKLKFITYGNRPESEGSFFEALSTTVRLRRASGCGLEEILIDGGSVPCRSEEDIADIREYCLASQPSSESQPLLQCVIQKPGSAFFH
ncbi:hypothetical protein DENSPDRAFT_879614 [Dentipellis sp. KUC8613]|nr:hypothetical protein DENSPDRAFT_879614 [Dentipellis sp. KUC8613]